MFLFGPPNVEKMKDRRNVRGLIHVLRAPMLDEEMRCDAARALGQLGDQRAIPHLIAVVLGVRRLAEVAAEALGQLGGQQSVEALITVLKSRDHSLKIAKEMARLGGVEVEPAQLQKIAGSNVHIAAAKALGQIGDIRAIETLTALQGDENENLRNAAAEALETMGAMKQGSV